MLANFSFSSSSSSRPRKVLVSASADSAVKQTGPVKQWVRQRWNCLGWTDGQLWTARGYINLSLWAPLLASAVTTGGASLMRTFCLIVLCHPCRLLPTQFQRETTLPLFLFFLWRRPEALSHRVFVVQINLPSVFCLDVSCGVSACMLHGMRACPISAALSQYDMWWEKVFIIEWEKERDVHPIHKWDFLKLHGRIAQEWWSICGGEKNEEKGKLFIGLCSIHNDHGDMYRKRRYMWRQHVS